MGDFINTIDLLGDEAVIDSIIEHTITEYKDDVIKELGVNAFAGCSNLKVVELPNLESMKIYSFYFAASGAVISFPAMTTLTAQSLAYSYIKGVRFSNLESIPQFGLYYQGDLVALILDNPDKVVALAHENGICATQIDGRNSAAAQKNQGYVYVPKALVDTYKNATNWTTLAHKIRAIEDYTLDGTLTGYLILGDETEIVDSSVLSVPKERLMNHASLVSIDLPNATRVGDDTFRNCALLESVNLPLLERCSDGNGRVFYQCTSLKYISLPALNYSGGWFFYGCTSLIEADLPALTESNSYLFQNCTSLKRANLPLLATVGHGIFYNCSSLEQACLPVAKTLKAYAFRHCDKVVTIDLPSVTSIDPDGNNFTFQTTKALKHLILRSTTLCTLGGADEFGDASYPSGIFLGTGYIYVPRNLVETYKVSTNWAPHANQFRALEDYTITGTTLGRVLMGDETEIVDDESTSVGASRFENNTILKSVNLSKVTQVIRRGFYGCTALESISFPVLETAANEAFKMCTSLTSIDLPKLKSVADHGFHTCSNLKSVSLPELTTAGSYVFYECDELEDVSLPALTSMSSYGFYGCNKLKSVNLPLVPELVATFYLCGALETVDAPLVTNIGINCFYDCSSLTSVNTPLVKTIGNAAFQNCKKLSEVNFPVVTTLGANAFENCQSLVEIDMPEVTTLSSSKTFNGCVALERVNLPNLTMLHGLVFGNCSAIKEINLPKVTYLGNKSSNNWIGNFEGCQVEKVTFPLVTHVARGEFSKCKQLAYVDLGKAEYLWGSAFSQCSALKTFIIRSTTMCDLYSWGTFELTPIADGTGYIYVPRALVESYKVATNWSTFANQFRALEDYTVDGTITGAIDESKI